MYFPPYDNENKPVIAAHHPEVPLVYFNIVKLKQNEQFTYAVPGYETCIVPATGLVDVLTGSLTVEKLGGRGADVWDGEPEGVYIPSGAEATIACRSEAAEIFIAGARFDEVLSPFAVRADSLDLVQYGSENQDASQDRAYFGTHIGQVGRLLVSELFTVGAVDSLVRLPAAQVMIQTGCLEESRHDEVYTLALARSWLYLQLLQPVTARWRGFHLVRSSLGFRQAIIPVRRAGL